MSDSPIIITRRSGWSSMFAFLGTINLLVLIAVLLIGLRQAPSSPDLLTLVWIGAGGLIGAIHCFFIAFLIDVFTDIRWFVSQMVEKHTKDD